MPDSGKPAEALPYPVGMIAANELQTLGHLAGASGVSYAALRRAAAQVKATVTINGIGHYDDASVQRLLELVEAEKQKRLVKSLN